MRQNTKWRGFLRESLDYMNYRVLSWRERAVFWLRLPGVLFRFQWSKLRDK